MHGERVVELGAGDLSLACELVRLGARYVSTYDRLPYVDPPCDKVYPDQRHYSFSQLASVWTRHDGGDLTVVCWPAVNMPSLEEKSLVNILTLSSKIAYLGKNTDGTGCGFGELFEYLLCRRVIKHVPHRQNSLTIYGEEMRDDETRPPTQEEVTWFTRTEVISYERSLAISHALYKR